MKIAALIGLVEVVAMSSFFLIINLTLSKLLENKAMSDMNVIARDRAQLVETYISGCCDFLNGYSKTPAVVEFFSDKNNPEYFSRIKKLTDSYASCNDFIEGLYAADWDTFTYVHTNPESVNKTFRSKEKAKELEENIKSYDEAFCTGIVLAPVTHKMVIPVYAPIFDSEGNAVGFAGAAFYTEGLSQKLSMFSRKDLAYSLINISTGEYIFNRDQTLVGQKCTDSFLQNAIKINKTSKSRTINFKTEGSVVSCYYMPERNWIFVVEDSNENVFRIVNSVRNIIAGICIFITILMLVICGFSVEYQMRPIRVIHSQIENFKKGDYTHPELLEKYQQRDDEFGTIANAVRELHGVLQNQYQLFFELLEAQTVGTLVTDFEDNNIVLVNKMALKLWGIDQSKKASLKIEDIKTHFDEEETEKIARVRELAKQSKEEIVYETTAIHDDGQKVQLLSHAKSLHLSNGDNVIIFSFIDISAQKKLEKNLMELSETDSLTQISNRRSGEYKIKKAMMEGMHGLYCLFDANKFKYINDNFGHSTGDKVLVEIANCMKHTFRTSDILVRLGGDEFVIFAPEIENKETGTRILERFMNNISQIQIPELNDHKISISLGAVIINSTETIEQMYKKADSLMYDCKKQGGNVFKFYS